MGDMMTLLKLRRGRYSLVEEKIPERAERMGELIVKGAREMMEKYECIGDVRGKGLLLGVEIVRDQKSSTPAPEEAKKIVCLENGLV